MPRTKIVVSPAALGGRKKPFHVNVSASTTSYQVVAKVLEKLQSRDPPLRYQLWATNSERGEHAKRNITAVYRTARGVLLNAAFMHVVWPHANTCMLLYGRRFSWRYAWEASGCIHTHLAALKNGSRAAACLIQQAAWPISSSSL